MQSKLSVKTSINFSQLNHPMSQKDLQSFNFEKNKLKT